MKHIINGLQIDLRTRTTDELELMVEQATERLERAEDELYSLREVIRRRPSHLRLVRR